MNEEKLQNEIRQMQDGLYRATVLLRAISTMGRFDDDEGCDLTDMGTMAEMAIKILEEDVDEPLKRLPKILEKETKNLKAV